MTHDFRKEAEECWGAFVQVGLADLGRKTGMGVIQVALRTAYERGVEDGAKVADSHCATEIMRTSWRRDNNHVAVCHDNELREIAKEIRALKDQP